MEPRQGGQRDLGDTKANLGEGRRWRQENATLSHNPSVCSLLTKDLRRAYYNSWQALCSHLGTRQEAKALPPQGLSRTKAPGKVYEYCLS